MNAATLLSHPEYIMIRGGSRIFCEGGQRGGAFIIMVWAWLQNIARKRGRCIRGSPSSFLLLSCNFGVFVVFISSARRKTPPLVAMKI